MFLFFYSQRHRGHRENHLILHALCASVSKFLLFTLLFSLTACKTIEPDLTTEHIPTEKQSFSQPTPTATAPFRLPSKYEPQKRGCYTGADISLDTVFSGDIKEFEKAVGVSHVFYQTHMLLDGEYPEKFILSCVSNGKIPIITIYPPETGEIYNSETLLKSAKLFSEIKTPVFITFYPLNKTFPDKDEYIAFFRLAKAVFTEYVDAVFIWSGGTGFEEFYPGDDVVDYVNINVIKSWFDSSETSQNFKQIKPVIVTISISHYSSKNNKYETLRAAEYLTEFYDNIKSYPEIKAVIYKSIIKNGDNFQITAEDALKSAYKSALDDKYFINRVETEAY